MQFKPYVVLLSRNLVTSDVTKLPKTCQSMHVRVCLRFNEFVWLSLRDGDYIIRILRYVIPYVIQHCTILNEILGACLRLPRIAGSE